MKLLFDEYVINSTLKTLVESIKSLNGDDGDD